VDFGRILPRSFYSRPTIEVARDLLGKVVAFRGCAGVIVETEAYISGGDMAAHWARGVTERTCGMFGPPGHAYVYLIYGMYECLNIVTEPDGDPGAVLIRALEPIAGVKAMRERRPGVRKLEDLANGPGKLTKAMGITRALNWADMTRGELVVRAPAQAREFAIAVTPRIGVTACEDWPLRFTIDGNQFVSRVPAGNGSRAGKRRSLEV
jgi:DNA-3-methyladenine glycosylase